MIALTTKKATIEIHTDDSTATILIYESGSDDSDSHFAAVQATETRQAKITMELQTFKEYLLQPLVGKFFKQKIPFKLR